MPPARLLVCVILSACHLIAAITISCNSFFASSENLRTSNLMPGALYFFNRMDSKAHHLQHIDADCEVGTMFAYVEVLKCSE